MTTAPEAVSPLAAAAELAAIPILVFGDDARFRWANIAAEEWLGLSERHLRRGTFREHGRPCAHLAEIVDQSCRARRSVVALGRAIGGVPLDLHACWSEEQSCVVLSVLPHRDVGAKASEAPALGFGRMLAHELKNPLASVRGAAQLIRREADPETAGELADLIVQDVDRITRLANHWSRVGDIRLGPREEINLNQLAVAAMDGLARADGRAGAILSEAFDPSLPSVTGDRDLLLQGVLNLMQNALDAVANVEAPRILVETRFDPGSRSRVAGRQAPLVLTVQDNGPGVSDALGSGVFTPFVTTKPAGEGLGLAFAARIAALHQGQLDYDSRPGRTRFSLRLPKTGGETA